MLIKFDRPTCPECGRIPVYIVESVKCLARIEPADDDEPGFEYLGESDVLWDTQGPERDAESNVSVVCENDHQWETRLLR